MPAPDLFRQGQLPWDIPQHATVDPTHGWLLQMTVVVEPQNHTAITVATGRPAMNASWLHENRVVVNS